MLVDRHGAQTLKARIILFRNRTAGLVTLGGTVDKQDSTLQPGEVVVARRARGCRGGFRKRAISVKSAFGERLATSVGRLLGGLGVRVRLLLVGSSVRGGLASSVTVTLVLKELVTLAVLLERGADREPSGNLVRGLLVLVRRLLLGELVLERGFELLVRVGVADGGGERVVDDVCCEFMRPFLNSLYAV
jgi:hypothetical protein